MLQKMETTFASVGLPRKARRSETLTQQQFNAVRALMTEVNTVMEGGWILAGPMIAMPDLLVQQFYRVVEVEEDGTDEEE